MLSSDNSFPFYSELSGGPLQNGSIYFGIAGQNPNTSPATVYWDSAGTQPAAQPIKTVNGMPSLNGSPARIWVNGAYSRLVLDSQGRQVLYEQTVRPVDFEVSVKQFGAKGDGTTDDGPAFNSALAASNIVVVPPGTYLINTSITGAYSNKKIFGNSATLKTTNTTNFNILQFPSTASGNEVAGIKFLGQGVTDTVNPVIGIDINQSNYNSVHDCIFTGTNYGVRLLDTVAGAATNPRNNRVENNQFLDAMGPLNGGYGVLNVRSTGTIISGNTFGNGTAGAFGRHCIYISAGSVNCVVIGNQCSNSVLSPLSINSGTTTGDDILGLVCTGNSFNGSGLTTANSYGITVTGRMRHSIISNNTVNNACQAGIFMQSANATMFPIANIISGNRIQSSGAGGLELYDIQYCKFSGNLITNSNVNNTATRDVQLTLNLGASAVGNTFADNTIMQAINAVQNNIYMGATINSCAVYGNLTGGATQAPINDAGNNFITPMQNGVQTVTYAATVTPDPTLGELIEIILTGSITIANVANAQKGSTVTFWFGQDSTGGRTVTWGSLYEVSSGWSDAGNTAGRTSSVTMKYDGARWRQIGPQQGWH